MAGASPPVSGYTGPGPVTGLLGGALLLALALLTLAAPLIESLLSGAYGIDADTVDLFARNAGPSAAHWLGTDELGRDLLLRLLYAGRISLLVGVAGACLASVLGTLIGIGAGYAGGALDALLMRLTDAMIALPLLPLLIVLAAVDLEKVGLPPGLVRSDAASLYRIILIVGLFGWTTVARLVRATTLQVRSHEYVRAAHALGVSPLRIALVHILPNVLSPLIIATTLSVGNMIMLESVLSYLGLGIQPPIPSWGNMLGSAQETMQTRPALALYPGLLIFVTVLAVNFLGDTLNARLDPRKAP